jgi:ribose 5-phosphate isomerase A
MLGAMDVEGQKRAAAERALDFVRPGMRLGLGTGSTARYFVEVGERVRAGLSVVVVPSSAATEKQAAALGIPLTTLDEPPALELTVGGADEIAPDLSLIKGGGGALLREKIVASASAALVVIADRSKWVSVLGRYPLPVEVVPFGLAATRRAVEAAAASAGAPGPALPRRTRVTMLSSRIPAIGSLMPRSSESSSRSCWPGASPPSPVWSSTACSFTWHKPLSSPDRTTCASSSGPDRLTRRRNLCLSRGSHLTC